MAAAVVVGLPYAIPVELQRDVNAACVANDVDRLKGVISQFIHQLLDQCIADEECALMHSAASMGHSEMIQYLIEEGATIDVRNGTKQTPLIEAAGGDIDHPAAVKLILDNGAAIDAVDVHQSTALHVAAHKGNLAVMKVLI